MGKLLRINFLQAQWRLSVCSSLNRLPGDTKCKLWYSILLPTHPSEWRNQTHLHPVSSGLLASSGLREPRCLQSLMPESWSAFQRTTNIRRVWRPQPLTSQCQQTMFMSALRIVQRNGFASCQVITFLPLKCRQDEAILQRHSRTFCLWAHAAQELLRQMVLQSRIWSYVFWDILSFILGLGDLNITWAVLEFVLIPLNKSFPIHISE